MAVTQNETARYSLKIAGTEYTQSDPKGLESLVVEDGLDIIGKCDATFSGQSGTTWSSIKSGDDVEVTFGGSTFKVFKGVVTSLRHGFQHGRDTLTVTAMDPLAKLAASRQTSSDFKDMTDSDVVNKVMGGAEVEIGLVDATPETRQYHLQRNESALEILRRYAARNPAYIVRANEGKVDFCKLQLSDPPIEIPINQLMSLDYNQSPRGLPESMAVRGWDYLTKSMVEGKATASDLQAIGGGTIAPSSAPIWKAGETAYITDQWVDTQQSAKDAATAQFFWTALQFLRGKAVVQGNGSLHAGVRVKFANHQSGFNPDAVVMSSRHRVFVGSGFTTEIVFASNTYADGGGGAGGAGGGAADALAGTPAAGGVGPSAAAFSGSGVGGTGALAAAASSATGKVSGALDSATGALGGLGDSTKGVFDNALGAAQRQVDAGMDRLTSGDIHGAIDNFKGIATTATGAISSASSTIVGGVTGAASAVVGSAAAGVGELAKGAGDSVKGVVGEYIADAGLSEKITEKANQAVDKVVGMGVSKVTNATSDVERKANEAISQAGREATSGLAEGMTSADSALNKGAQEAHDAVEKPLEAVRDATGPVGDILLPKP